MYVYIHIHIYTHTYIYVSVRRHCCFIPLSGPTVLCAWRVRQWVKIHRQWIQWRCLLWTWLFLHTELSSSWLRYLARVGDLEATDTEDPNLNYGLVVDCGSSGSRIFVYFWPRHNGNPHDLLDIKQMRDRNSQPVVKKIKPGTNWNLFIFYLFCPL